MKFSDILCLIFLISVQSICSVPIRYSDDTQLSMFEQKTPATHGKLSMNFKLTAVGTSVGGLQYNITNNVGTMVIRGETYHTVAYYTQVMGLPAEVRWFDLFGIAENSSNLAIVYIGCNPPPNTSVVTIIWEEDFFTPLTPDSPGSSDACIFTDLSGKPDYTFPVNFPPLIGLPTTPYNTSIQIRGKEVYLDSTHGWMTIAKTNYSIIAITAVDCDDCGENCVECPKAPWYELHFIYYSVPLSQTGFGIFYIYPYNTTFVQLNYTLCLPTLSTPAIQYTANWSGTINAVQTKYLDNNTKRKSKKSFN